MSHQGIINSVTALVINTYTCASCVIITLLLYMRDVKCILQCITTLYYRLHNWLKTSSSTKFTKVQFWYLKCQSCVRGSLPSIFDSLNILHISYVKQWKFVLLGDYFLMHRSDMNRIYPMSYVMIVLEQLSLAGIRKLDVLTIRSISEYQRDQSLSKLFASLSHFRITSHCCKTKIIVEVIKWLCACNTINENLHFFDFDTRLHFGRIFFEWRKIRSGIVNMPLPRINSL